MLVDAVILNDELGLLRTRLAVLGEHVDHFVVAESRLTFSGRAKPLHLRDNAHLFADFADRLTVVEYTTTPGPVSAWEREDAARNAVRDAVRRISPDGVVLLCDLDELPSPQQCRLARRAEQMMVVPLVSCSRRANWRVEHETPCLVTRVVPVARLPDDLATLRWDRRTEIPWLGGEWGSHLSYLGFTAADLAAKYRSFSHAELDFPAASGRRLLRLADRMAVDHLGRVDYRGRGLLTVQEPGEWNAVQRGVQRLHPEWFDTRRRLPPRWVRRLSATLIDEVVSRRSSAAAQLLEHPWRPASLLGRTSRGVVLATARQDWDDLSVRIRSRVGSLVRAARR